MKLASPIVLTLILAVYCAAQVEPEIKFISSETVTDVGGDAELVCSIRNEQGYPVSWLRDGDIPVPVSRGDQLLVKDKRFNLKYDKNDSSYTLSITNVRRSDATKYLCQVIISLNPENIKTEGVEIRVRQQPAIKDELSPKTKRATEGRPADLECEASGYPPPDITWTKKDGSLLPEGKVSFNGKKLHIAKVSREDRGLYECFAHNNVGPGQRKAISLEVEFSPKISIPRPRIPQALYYEAELSCEIEAYPPPAIIWTKDGVEIRNNGSFLITHFATENDNIMSTAKIFEVGTNSYGEYECTATNRHGKDAKSVELYESTLPICPPQCGDFDLSHATHNKHHSRGFFLTVSVALATRLILV